MRPIEEERLRESVLPEVTIQLLSSPDCAVCKARPAILEAFYKGVRVSCCSEKECQEKAKREAIEAWRKALKAEFELANRQRVAQ